jgi:hypothetical protein
MRQFSFDFMLDLVFGSVSLSSIKGEIYQYVGRTFVTAVPARKKTTRRAKKTLHGWIACATAVSAATTIPSGVRDFRDQALYTSARVAGTAIHGFILSLWAWILCQLINTSVASWECRMKFRA